ncbi:E3 ubiquitin-protein ligase RNF169-like [Belonocnema kinseyi]|uniref:E3 ubiquitin-protein ligase RNF169-like n=1 Tax=Belonocnema kinseyi TaxID=2817044 RepID=UPI00143CD7CE|nr:E3 ubiquitin-protein ligase RNF169-like [Belonocnema kinseyi]
MATCLKRTSKLFDPSLWRSPSHVNLRDLLCPVCRGILIEPVTLPCEHNLCLRCLNGTVEHNNLNCPLCRTRVGSWLRTAGKSNTLVNLRLWEIIRTKFPKEVEGKKNGDERNIDLDSGYAARTKILSAAGEIRKEYEAQLHLAEEERRRKIQAEAIASEALIRKIQAEEQQQFAQLAQDELLAKTLAKEEISKVDPKMKSYGESSKMSNRLVDKSKTEPRVSNNMQKVKTQSVFDGATPMVTKFKTSIDPRKTNIALISKIRVESYASSIKSAGQNTCKDSSQKLGTFKPLPVQDAVTRLFKNQVTKFVQPNSSGFTLEPSCSNSNVYGLQTKEELHVPNDVLSSKKKSLGVEICMNTVTDDARIGSAESAESHDSINQEIHHFKPIKAMQRTPLRTTRDGRQIDPKVIRVVPILKKVSNAVPKPPSPSRVKRNLGCSWSAFRGKIQDSRMSKVTQVEISEPESKPVTSTQITTATLVKPQVSDKLDQAPDMSFDTNKNYAKNINKIINGTKLSKKLNLESNEGVEKAKKSWESCNEPKSTCDSDDPDANNTDGESVNSEASSSRTQKVYSEECPVENIAERIKKRKTHTKIRYNNNTEDFVRRSSRKRATAVHYVADDFESFDENSEVEDEPPKRKRVRKTAPKLEKVKRVVEISPSKIISGPPELTMEAPQKKRRGRKPKPVEVQSSSIENDNFETGEKSTNVSGCDDVIISEQKRIEMQLLQEQKDRELAERLQAQFNEWESMAGRTRNSRRVFESGNEGVLGLELGRRGRRNADPQSGKQASQTKSGRCQRRPQQGALK